MPVLSMFYGIIVRMYNEKSAKHNKPHIHVECAGDELVVTFDGETLEGGLPPSKRRLLDAWIEIHRDELSANWTTLSNGEGFFKIDPLK
ncbi:MAG: DUF4160 domain-containing protein [Kiritimatiellaeota bacterium]|nr:DUF4160 domain-containing protein [Kiritimatiellota bacterium]